MSSVAFYSDDVICLMSSPGLTDVSDISSSCCVSHFASSSRLYAADELKKIPIRQRSKCSP